MYGIDMVYITAGAAALVLISFILFLASRYRRCPSDKILVIYGNVGKNQAARCIHGGGALVWPLIQDSAYLSLTPITMNIPLQNALSHQNIRIHVPSTFTVGVSTQPSIMQNAAERLLGVHPSQIDAMAQEIIFGQLRLTVASLTIEEINQNREKFLAAIRTNVEPELNKIGLYLINVNITDISDESDYIESIGKKAASEAINTALVEVAQQDQVGAIGQAEANREKEIRVREKLAESVKGQKAAEAAERIFVQQQESAAQIGEAEANRAQEVAVAENKAEAIKGKKAAEADQRIFTQQKEASAIAGENESRALIAESNATLHSRAAVAKQQGEVAQLEAEAAIQRAQYQAELERLRAAEIVAKEVERQKIEIAAAATAEQTRLEAKGQADAILLKYEAEAKGIRQVLESKSQGYNSLIESCNGDARAAATLLMVEKLDDLVQTQVEAIKNLKIDKITVWDGGNNADGSATSNFVSSLAKSLPPLQDIAGMAGVELPGYLGSLSPSAPAETRAPENSNDIEPELLASVDLDESDPLQG